MREQECGAFLVSFEDLFINLPDQSVSGLSDLRTREKELPALGKPDLRRRFVTVGHMRGKESDRRIQLRELRLRENAETGIPVREPEQLIHKPASGLYSLWHELGLTRAFPARGEKGRRPGYAPDYAWPPDEKPRADNDDSPEQRSHSAPGRLLEIAEHLLGRASSLIEDTNTTCEAVRGAVLATQALELLGCKTPTLSLDALSLKHRFEVCAECHFVGVEYHQSINERLQDIECNLRAMSLWLDKSRQEEFVLNGEAKITTPLVAILDEHGAFEEAEICRERLRVLHNRIIFRGALRREKVLRLLTRPFGIYVEWVLRSSWHFIAAMVAATIVFSALFYFSGKFIPSHKPVGSVPEAVFMSVGAMLAQTPGWDDISGGDPWGGGTLVKLALYGSAAAFGVLNFGILVSYLYSKISRK